MWINEGYTGSGGLRCLTRLFMSVYVFLYIYIYMYVYIYIYLHLERSLVS